MKAPRLVKVVWMDAYMEFAVNKGDTVGLLEVETVGWLIHQTDELLNVAQEDSGGEWRSVTAIPRSCVVKVQPFKAGKK